MRTRARIGLLLAAVATPALAQENAAPVRYEVAFPNAVHHEARISVTFSDVGEAPLVLRMSRSSPGRYAIHEFAKNVYSVSAVDGTGRPLPVGRSDPYSWTVAGHGGEVTVTYTLFADRADGTYSQIDATHAHLNMPATFMWAGGLEERPVEVTFRPFDPSWKVATQLQPVGDGRTFRAPDLQYLMDSPTELSDHELREWQVEEEGRRYTIRLAVHHEGTSEEVDRFAGMAERVVREQIALFGDVPDFDFGTYTFLADYLPHASGDGMEHRNSTYLTNSRSLSEADFAQIGTLSHEFIHAWNVERLRPAELEPFDFERANPTPSLWFSEGFTSYYGPLILRRAGLSSIDEYLEGLSGTLSAIVNAPGRRYGSPQEMSLRAPFVDAATAIDPTNHSNIFVSYYPYGAVIALALDLELRQHFPDRSLDDYMRQVWRTHGATERPFRPQDLREGLAALTGDPAFAERFFARTIEGSGLPDFEPLLRQAGLLLRRRHSGEAWLGPARLNVEGEAVTLDGGSTVGSPLYAAGLDGGDEIVRIGTIEIDRQEDWDAVLSRHSPGDAVRIDYIQRGLQRSATIIFAEDPTLEVVRFEAANLRPTAEQLSFRKAWLGDEADAS
ncbi:M61 family metallopeptidase [Sphingosinicella sp. CPCC 101087]|uniref:M61 family metallopeptidase n=1 Tax=Sphingosinicella sp. CPCC 101087 TaxID=2497754 RepID=UPI00101BB34D|nr:PDZ domain-containing protein [Sphingosinicella sp. CPCC 101087]